MECLRDIATRVAAVTDGTPNYDAILQSIRSAQPVCSSYLDKLADLAKMFKDGGAIASALFAFANRWGSVSASQGSAGDAVAPKDCRRLGQEFVTAVAEVTFYGGAPHVNVRMACLATNIVAPTVVDGIGKLIVKSDVQKIAKSKDAADALEEDIIVLRSCMLLAVSTGKLTKEKSQDLEFLFMIRCIGFHTGKGKKSFDNRDFESVQEIRATSLEEITHAVAAHTGKTAELAAFKPVTNAWKKAAASDAKSATTTRAEEPPANTALSLQIDDPKRIAFEHGKFTENCLVVEKKGDQQTLYEVLEINQKVKLREFVLCGKQSAITATIKLDMLVEEWRMRPGPKPVAISDEVAKAWMVPNAFKLGTEAANVYVRLSEVEAEFAGRYDDKLQFCMNPREVRTTVKCAAGALRLGPFTDIHRISVFDTVKDAERVSIQIKNGTKLKLSPPEFPTTTDNSKWSAAKCGLIPFWWVVPTHINENANMEFEKFISKDKLLSCWIITNKVEIQPYTKLTVYAPKAPVKELANALEKSTDAPAAKKARATRK